jgi:hypothetical protein
MTFHAREFSGLARPNFVSAISSEVPTPLGGFSVMRALYRSVAGNQSRNPRSGVEGVPGSDNRSSKEAK